MNSRGFTLLEVMVAVSIFAITALTLLNAQQSQIATDSRLKTKTYAHWVALNYLEELKLNASFPEVGQTVSKAELAGQQWVISSKVQPTPTSNVRMLIVSVSPQPDDTKSALNDTPPEPVTVLTGFLSRPTPAATQRESDNDETP